MDKIMDELHNTNENINLLIKIINKNNSIHLSHLKDIEEILTFLNEKILDIINKNNSDTLLISNHALERIENNNIAMKTLKPFLPYMLLYNLSIQSNNI